MRSETLLSMLEEAAEKAGIRVRYEGLELEDDRAADGLCTLKGERFLFIRKDRSVAEKIEIVLRALRGLDWTGIYLKPLIRQLIGAEGTREPF